MEPQTCSGNPIRFLADAMLGRLAVYLRLVGFDTAFQSIPSGSGRMTPLMKRNHAEKLVQRAVSEHRILLSRSTLVCTLCRQRNIAYFQPRSNASPAQFREVSQKFGLRRLPFTSARCPECNVQLAHAARESVEDSVPDHIFLIHDTFLFCPVCERVFWPGSHCRFFRESMRISGAWIRTRGQIT